MEEHGVLPRGSVIMGWRGCAVALNPNVSLPLGELVDGWEAHVRRFASELDVGSAETGVWGAHDYIGALHIRDAVERGVAALPGDARADAMRHVAAADRDFVAATQLDDRERLATFMARELRNSGWWWQRVPGRGPVHDEIAQ